MGTRLHMSLLFILVCTLLVSSVAMAQTTGRDSVRLDTITPLSIDSVVASSALHSGTFADSAETIFPLTPERKALLEDYAGFNNLWRYVSLLESLIIFSLLAFLGLSARFRDWAKVAKKPFLILWLYVVLLLSAYYFLSLPLSIYREFIIEHQYGFSNQTFMAWFGESFLSLFIMFIIAVLPVWFFYRLVNRARRWWLTFSLGSIPFMVFVVVIAPIFISPLFNDFVPLENKALESEIRSLATSSGIEGADIFQVNSSKQSSKINAYVTGLLATKRIVLYDTMIKNFTVEEIKFVMGHEMGHYIEGHIWYGLAIAVILIAAALFIIDKTIHGVIRRFKSRLGFDNLGDMASLPLVILFAVVISFFSSPISAGASRYMEHRSDRFGMESSGVSGEDAAIAFEKLSAYNLSDPDPDPFTEFWFYGHPSIKKRIAYVRSYRR